jgi:ribose-phosphate pyrophosphokinase
LKIYGCATHALFSASACERLESAPFEEVCVTDTVHIPEDRTFSKLKVLSIGELLAKAITYNHEYQSVSSLFPD